MTNNNKKLLKGLLAGASALTVVIGSAQVASAAAVNVGNANTTSSALVRGGNAGNPTGGWGDNHVGNAADWIDFNNANKTLTINQANAVIQGVDVNAGGSIVIGATPISIGSIYDKTGGNGNVNITVSANNALTFTGTAFNGGNDDNYSDVQAITLGAGSKLNVTSVGAIGAGDLVANIDGAVANNGALSISATNGAVTLDGDVGANFSLASVTVDATANAVKFDGTTTTAGNIVVSNATNLVTFTGATKAASLNVGAGAGGVLFKAGHTGAASFTDNGLITVAAAQNITGAVTTTAANTGTLAFQGGTNITSAVGTAAVPLLAVNLATAANANTVATADISAKDVNFGANATAGTTLTLGVAGKGQTITGNLDNTQGGAGKGILTFFGNSAATGQVGATHSLAAINFAENNSSLTIGSGIVPAAGQTINAVINFGAFTGTNLTIAGSGIAGGAANNLTVTKDITAGVANKAVLNVNGDYVQFAGNIGNVGGFNLNAINVAGTNRAYFSGDDVKATTLALQGDGAAVFNGATTFTGAIATATAGQGVVRSTGGNDVEFVGAIGANNTTVGTVVVDTAAGNITFFNGDIFANQINIGRLAADNTDGTGVGTEVNSKARFIGNVNAPIAFITDGNAIINTNMKLNGAVTTTAPNKGTLNFAQNNDITNQIGDATNGLLAVNLSNGANGTTNIKADVFAQDVKIGANGGSIINLGSTGAGKTITGNFDAGVGAGTLNVFGESTITGTIGATNALTTISFAEAGAQLTVGGATVKSPINFANDGTLVLNIADANDRTITGAITTATDSRGTISVTGNLAGRNVTLAGDIGVAGQGLAAVNVGTASLTVSNDLFAHSVVAGSISFDATGAHDVGIGYANGGKISMNEGVNFRSGNGIVTSLGNLNTFTMNTAHTATFDNGVHFSSENFVNNAGAGKGAMTFNGNHTITGALGQKTASLAAVNVDGVAGTVATFSGDIFANKLAFAADGTAELSGNVSGEIKGAAGPLGTVVFKNTNDVTVGGAVTVLKAVKIAGKGNVEFVNGANSTPNAVVFDSNSTLKLTGYAGTTNTKFTSANANQGTVALTINATVGTDTYGTAVAPLKAIQLNGTNLTVDGADKVFAGITTTVDKAGIVDYTVTQPHIFGIGAQGASLAEVKLGGGNYTFRKDVFATNINFTSGANTDKVTVEGALNGTFNFAANGGNGGILEVANNGSIGAVTGAVDTQVVFTGNGSLNGDITAEKTTTGVGTVSLGKNATVTGALNVNGTTLDVNSSTMTVTGLTTATGPITLAVATDGNTAGKLVLASVDAKAATGANTVVTINSTGLPADGKEFTILTVTDTNAATKDLSAEALAGFDTNSDGTNTTVKFSNAFVKGAVSGGKLTLSRDLSSLQALVVNSNGTEVGGELAAMFNAQAKTLTGEASSFITKLGNMLASGTATDQDVTKAFDALSAGGQQSGNVLKAVADTVTSTLGARIGTVVSSALPALASNDVVGMAAGDEASRNLGAWANVFGGRGTQQSHKDVVGFKSNVQGAMIGFDAAINDSTVIGVAASMAKTTAKFKGVKDGDKTKATTYLFAGYGVHDFGNNWLVQGNALVGNSNVKNTSNRGLAGVATGKFDSMTYAAEVLGGYRFNMGDTGSVTPLAGIRVARFSDGSYTETGALVNERVKDSTRDKIEGVIGARTTMTAEVNGVAITPEFHGAMNYDFKAKAPKVDVRIDGLSSSVVSKGSKPARVSWNLGAGVMAKSGMFEYGAGYDANLSNKYIAHQGSLKVRVNF